MSLCDNHGFNFISTAMLYCFSCLGLMYFSVDLFHDNDVKFVELRIYLTSCVFSKEFSSLHHEV